MRVTMVNKYYPPHLGGIEYHVRDLAEALSRRDGVQVEAIVSNEARCRLDEEVAGVAVHRLRRLAAPASTPIAPGMPRTLRRLVPKDGDSGLIHLHFPYPWGEFSWLLAGMDIPTVMTYHSDIVRQQTLSLAYRPIMRRVLERVDLIIASSPNMVYHSPVLSRLKDKCRVVPFGIDVDLFRSTKEVEVRATELRRTHGERLVLFVGRLIYYKGIDTLVQAMTRVSGRLIVIGQGPLDKELVDLAEVLGIRDRVSFLPPVSPLELRAWYRAADVFCLPSVARSEAFGLVQLEAQASGTPVVSTQLTTGVPYANQDGATGLVVPPGDFERLGRALERLLTDEALRRRLGRQAEQRVRRHFTTEQMVEGTLAVYAEAREERRAFL